MCVQRYHGQNGRVDEHLEDGDVPGRFGTEIWRHTASQMNLLFMDALKVRMG